MSSPPKQDSPPKGDSPPKNGSPTTNGSPTKVSTAPSGIVAKAQEEDEDYYTRPDFIYGGPFIAYKKPSPFIETVTPINIQLQGTFKQSYAYFSLKDRLPVILTKLIDYFSREGAKIKSEAAATDEDIKSFIQHVAKLKNELVTNKDFEPFIEDTENAKKWNEWIENQDNRKFFNCPWIFAECYVYRKIKEGAVLTKGLGDFDYFSEQKNKSFDDNVETMCLVADRMVTMINKSEKERRKADFVTLLKICLWANKCDLSLSLGETVSFTKEDKPNPEGDTPSPLPPIPPLPPQAPGGPPPKAKKGKGSKDSSSAGSVRISSDPFQMILDLKDKLLVDDSGKIADAVAAKAESIYNKSITSNATFKFKCSCQRLANAAGVPICKQEIPPSDEAPEEAQEEVKEEKKETPKIPCPAKMTVPQSVIFDIVCDNAGYELFADLCLAHFLIAQEIIQKVRFHVKNMPWFISDVTPKDFKYVIDACMKSTFSIEKPAVEGVSEARTITADNLRALGEQWDKFVQEGTFLVMDEEFWTTPHCFKDMKKIDYNMYRKLQYTVAVMYKGDLNYRKLLGERNCNPTLGLEAAMQGYIPCPAIAVRTVKSEVICGLPRGKWDQLNKINDKWMRTGEYGVIQYCNKGEPLKVADRPCIDYCKTCFGIICPEHKDM